MKPIANRIGNRVQRISPQLRAAILALAAVAILAPALRADNASPAARAVRLSNVDGQVRIAQSGEVLADAAVENTPLFEGSQLVTSDDGRAEIQFEDGSLARLSPASSLTLSALHGQGAGGEAEILLEGGLAYFELQGSAQSGSIRIRFGDSVVTASGFTILRINLDNPPGELAVFSGNAHLERGSALSVDLHGGESVTLSASDPTHYTLAESIEPDSWDSWNADRDQQLTALSTTQTPVSKAFPDSANPAWNDLDANGNWYNVPGQGPIWSPYDASNSGWDPYGVGYWVFSPRFGYTWVSGYGWGYLPYQCGMWSYYDAFGWGWSPGMNGCFPWWNTGIYGLNLGTVYGGYRPPVFPRPPHGRIPGGPHRPGPVPVLAVNRHTPGAGTVLPPRDRSTPVTIAGHTVQPVHPASPRPAYGLSAQGGAAYRGTTVYPAQSLTTSRGTGASLGTARPGVGYIPQPRSGSTGGSHASAGGSASHASAPAASHSSGGASSGGGSHTGGGGAPSGGGGGHAGGGGGASAGGGSHR
jgi:hypothetical protein